jgi:D-alanyl-D-alanine carboxypeptidase
MPSWTRAAILTMRMLVAALPLALLAATPNPARAADMDVAERKRALRAVVERALEECRVPGAAVAVRTPIGRWSIATGLADVATGRHVRRVDRFAIRSITKSFVVTLILQLAADGKLSLDNPISRYYPGVPQGAKIKLRHLANMTSGIFEYQKDPQFLQALGDDPRRRWATAELIGFAVRRPLNFAREPSTNTRTPTRCSWERWSSA